MTTNDRIGRKTIPERSILFLYKKNWWFHSSRFKGSVYSIVLIQIYKYFVSEESFKMCVLFY